MLPNGLGFQWSAASLCTITLFLSIILTICSVKIDICELIVMLLSRLQVGEDMGSQRIRLELGVLIRLCDYSDTVLKLLCLPTLICFIGC